MWRPHIDIAIDLDEKGYTSTELRRLPRKALDRKINVYGWSVWA